MKLIVKKSLVFFVLGVSNLYSWEINTHQALTRCAITNECNNNKGFRAENLQNFVNKDALLSKKDYTKQEFEDYSYTYINYAKGGEEEFSKWKIGFNGIKDNKAIYKNGTYIDMIEAGSILEDAIWDDARGILDSKVDGRFNNHFYDPQQGGIGLEYGWRDYTDAVTWAINGAILKADNKDIRTNYYSYQKALDYYKESFISSEKTDREKNQAKMFVSLGHLLHLLQDMHVPAHTRDDSHSEYDLLEFWARERGGFRLNSGKFSDVNQRILNKIKNYNTLDNIKINKASNAFNDYPISSSFYILEATFTSNNFVSMGKDIIVSDKGTIFDSDHPHPDKDNDVEEETIYENKLLGYITSAKYYCNSLRNTVGSIIPGNIEPSLVAMKIEKGWNRGFYVLQDGTDDNPIVSHALNLIPRAVGASEAFINYFFRGRIEAKIKDTKLIIKNISNKNLAQSPDNIVFKKNGNFIVKYDTKDGISKKLLEVQLDKDLNFNDTFTSKVNFIQILGKIDDLKDERNITILYDGTIGQERGLAVSKISLNDIDYDELSDQQENDNDSDSNSSNDTGDDSDSDSSNDTGDDSDSNSSNDTGDDSDSDSSNGTGDDSDSDSSNDTGDDSDSDSSNGTEDDSDSNSSNGTEDDSDSNSSNGTGDDNDDATVNNFSTSKLKKTGQFLSYDEDGNKVRYGSIKDDGYYQAGVFPDYEKDYANDVIIDYVTGLMWQDNAEVESVTKPWLTEENYNKCEDRHESACYDTSGDTATTYCENLTLGGYSDWRLPTRKELGSIVDYGRHNPAMDPKFEYFVSDDYWSSTTDAYFHGNAWVVDFWSGGQDYYYGGKAGSRYVRCVREGE